MLFTQRVGENSATLICQLFLKTYKPGTRIGRRKDLDIIRVLPGVLLIQTVLLWQIVTVKQDTELKHRCTEQGMYIGTIL